MISFKPGIRLTGLRPEMAAALVVIAEVFGRHGLSLTITSALDGQHGEASATRKRSLHYSGLALDLRLPGRETHSALRDAQILDELRVALGPEFDVVAEGTHWHVEHDPDATPPVVA